MKRLWVVALLAACSDPVKSDVEMFCSATVGSTWKTFNEVGPYVAEHARSDEFKQLLLQPVRNGMTVWEFADKVRELMKRTGVERCKTLDVIVPPRPPS